MVFCPDNNAGRCVANVVVRVQTVRCSSAANQLCGEAEEPEHHLPVVITERHTTAICSGAHGDESVQSPRIAVCCIYVLEAFFILIVSRVASIAAMIRCSCCACMSSLCDYGYICCTDGDSNTCLLGLIHAVSRLLVATHKSKSAVGAANVAAKSWHRRLDRGPGAAASLQCVRRI